jgi:hypothetical protein
LDKEDGKDVFNYSFQDASGTINFKMVSKVPDVKVGTLVEIHTATSRSGLQVLRMRPILNEEDGQVLVLEYYAYRIVCFLKLKLFSCV